MCEISATTSGNVIAIIPIKLPQITITKLNIVITTNLYEKINQIVHKSYLNKLYKKNNCNNPINTIVLPTAGHWVNPQRPKQFKVM